MLQTNREAVYERLPKTRDFWFAFELGYALGVTKRTIQRAAKQFSIGRKVRHGPRGTYVFQWHDIENLISVIHPTPGNPENISKHRERMSRKYSIEELVHLGE